ncbi:MAG: rRNA maturation RNase YbeY [Verrucomicrobiota bacterium]|nr:rRNA maturation RNase YbeY [Verrucomicrobiota bacterium]
MPITIRNLQRKVRMDCPALQRFAERALAKIPHHSLGEITVLLISDRRMATLHRQFMDIAGPTDVITFQHGEIFISVETAKRNARRFHSSVEDEVKLYLVHGLLHLSGFDDKIAADAREMEKAQARIIKSTRRAV